MNKINWKRKLSSRKFWVALAGWVSSMLAAFNITENVTAQVSIIIAGIGSLCVYILAESSTDAQSLIAQKVEKTLDNDNKEVL